MRLVKIFGLVAVAVVAAMALVGVTSASATSTQLCNSHDALGCDAGQAATTVSMNNSGLGVGTLLTAVVNVLCLTISGTGSVLSSGEPQVVHLTALSFTNCGTKSSHNNCQVEVPGEFEEPGDLPLAELLKTGLDTGAIEGKEGEILLHCENFDTFSLDIHCIYDVTELQFPVGAQHLTTFNTLLKQIGGESCPEESYLDGLLKTTANRYILGPEEPADEPKTALCKAHTETCAEKDQVKSVDLTTTKAPVLYNTVANVECESSLLAATVLSPAEPQKLDVETLSWKECHTQGAAENCTVTTSALPTVDLDGVALNLGNASTLGLEIEVDCLILDLIELDCTFDSDVTLSVEGALHKSASGHGRFIAAKAELDLTEGGEHCPDEMKWDASYEASEHTYVVSWS